ncbi:MAG TPA: sulfite exporter TauE/SafE family protein [Puia sp.]|nr:sulfite exporter TauE/SafE family protein [Puia sp.]
MTVIVFTFILLTVSVMAGLLGSLTGLGGGVVLIPVLSLLFKVDIHYAIGTSLISVIATSSGAAAAYVKEGISNIRLGIFLELATTTGAVTGAILAGYITTSVIAVIFGCILIFSAIASLAKYTDHLEQGEGSYLVRLLKLGGSFTTRDGKKEYTVKNIGFGFLMMNVAGVISGLLGIGSGALKVIAMDSIMRVPFKVSTTTSNFMIGVTAAASAGIYLKRGYIDPGLSMPVVIGVLTGAFIGSKFLFAARTRSLKILFAIVVLVLAAEMIYNGIKHNI